VSRAQGRTARIPSQRVFRISTNAADGEVNTIGTQKANVRRPTNATPRIARGGSLKRTFVPSEEAQRFGEKKPLPIVGARAWQPTAMAAGQRDPKTGRFTAKLPPKPTRSIVTGKEFT
jgi:hypothetical protein